MDYLQFCPSGQGLVEKAEFQGENNNLHHVIKKCITGCTPSEGELWSLLGRLNLEFRIVCILLAFFFDVMYRNIS